MISGNGTTCVIPESGMKVVLCILLVIICLCGMLGNTLTCLIVYRKAPMRSAINILLANIAVADLVLSVIVAPFTFCRLLWPHAIHYLNVCVLMSVVKDASLTVASLTLFTISVDRFLIIVHKKDRLCVGQAKTYLSVIWWLAIFLCFPQFLSNINKTVLFDDIFCVQTKEYFRQSKTIYSAVQMSVAFFIPVSVLLYIYASIVRTVQLSSKKIHNHSSSVISVSVTQYSSKLGLPTVATPYRLSGDLNAKRRAFATIMILYTTLLACWLPYTILRMVDDAGLSLERNQSLYFLLLTLGLLKSALYPTIFCLRNKKFRTACYESVPSQIKISRKCFRIKSRRVNPKAVYEISEAHSKF